MRIVAALLLCGALAACASVSHKRAPAAAPSAYIILFQGHATAILPRAAAVINSVAANANAHPDELVQLLGPPTKPAFGYNPRLAAQRMREVAHALEAAGVDKERIVRALLVGANLKSDGTGAQRVEIRLLNKPARATKARTAAMPTPSQIAELTPY